MVHSSHKSFHSLIMSPLGVQSLWNSLCSTLLPQVRLHVRVVMKECKGINFIHAYKAYNGLLGTLFPQNQLTGGRIYYSLATNPGTPACIWYTFPTNPAASKKKNGYKLSPRVTQANVLYTFTTASLISED